MEQINREQVQKVVKERTAQLQEQMAVLQAQLDSLQQPPQSSPPRQQRNRVRPNPVPISIDSEDPLYDTEEEWDNDMFEEVFAECRPRKR